MIKIGVIFGGKSTEHEISVITACQAMSHLDEEKYEIIPIFFDKSMKAYSSPILKDIEIYKEHNLIEKYAKEVDFSKDKNGVFIYNKKSLFKKKVTYLDIVFPIGHGAFLEDGKIQGMLEILDLPIVGPSYISAGIAQDKVLQKAVYDANGIKNVKNLWFYKDEYFDNKEEIIKRIKSLKYPVIIKPATQGSSIGIEIAENDEELANGIDSALKYDEKILVEEMLKDFREVNIAVLGTPCNQIVSAIEEVFTTEKILSFSDKYEGGGKSQKGMASQQRKIPANLTEKEKETIEKMAKKAHNALGLSGVSRFDFMIAKDEIYLNEVNSIPGSLSFYLFEAINIPFDELIERLIKTSIKEYQKKEEKIHSFETNVLKTYKRGAKGAKFK